MEYNQNMAEKKIPFSKPDPVMVKAVLRTLRDQLKAQREQKPGAAPSAAAKRD